MLSIMAFVFLFAFSRGGDDKQWLKGGKCKGLWRPEKLPGRCFNLKLHHTYDELRSIQTVNTSTTCRVLCCNLGDKCTSWQYEHESKECKLGGPVRLGSEAGGTAGWCEPNAPIPWSGNKLLSRGADGICVWGQSLPVQCFGLGPERKSADKLSLAPEECAQACCASSSCAMWQAATGRGCYFGSGKGVGCDDKTTAARYEGGRKCVPGFCGGLESSLLVRKEE